MYVHSLYETLPREFLSLILLGKELKKRGVVCDIEQLKLASNRFFRMRPGVRLVPFYYRDSNVSGSLAKISWKDEAAINLCWEQFSSEWSRKATLPQGKMVENGMLFTAWGEKYADLLRGNGVPEKQIRITGSMKLDLSFHKELLLDKKTLAELYGLDVDKPWLLIAWNFASREDALRKYCIKHKLDYPEDLYPLSVASRAAHWDLIKTFGHEFPNHEIIFRIHPSSTDGKQIKELLSKHNNIHFNCDLDIANWTLSSEVVFSWSSTALIEAIVANVPALAFEPIRYFEKFGYEVGTIIPKTMNADEALHKLKNPQSLKKEVNHEALKAWYGDIDGKAHIRVADLCMEVLEKIDTHKIPRNVIKTKLKNKTRSYLRRGIHNFPALAPVLSSFAYGNKQRIFSKKPVPLKQIHRVLNGEDISLLNPFLQGLE